MTRQAPQHDDDSEEWDHLDDLLRALRALRVVNSQSSVREPAGSVSDLPRGQADRSQHREHEHEHGHEHSDDCSSDVLDRPQSLAEERFGPSAIAYNAGNVTQNIFIFNHPQRRTRRLFTEQEVVPQVLPRERMSESVVQGETDNNRRERGDEHQVSSPPSSPIREAAQETTHQNTPHRATAQVTSSPARPSTSRAQTEVIHIRSESPRQVDGESIDPEARWYVVYKGVKPGIARGITEAKQMKGVHISGEFDTMGRVMRVPTYQAAWALWQEKLTDREVVRFVL